MYRSLAVSEGDGSHANLMGIVSEVFGGSADVPEKGPCDGNYCSALGSAVVRALMTSAFVEHQARKKG